MTAENSKPVQLLRDQRGVYGIGVSDAFDHHALAQACGIDPPPGVSCPNNLILRPDRFDCTEQGFAVLQKITRGFRRGIFRDTREDALRQVIHHEALRRAGLPWPPGKHFWPEDKKQQARNGQIYHGLRLLSFSVINRLIGEAIEEAADADAIKTARRFPFRYRETIYRAGARSRRALQLAETFHVLALRIYTSAMPGLSEAGLWGHQAEADSLRREAADLVERGARLRDVAAMMRVPMALRHIKPGATHLVSTEFLYRHPEWCGAFMPESLPRMRTWLRAVEYAQRVAGDDFAVWTAKHVEQMPHRSLEELEWFLSDVGDWVHAADDDRSPGAQFIVRPFTPAMSLRTVTTLSAEWHEAVVSSLRGPQYAFPAPWFPAAKVNGYDITPVDNSADLYREGVAMHHCAGTYADMVRHGGYYVYSVRHNGERVATAGLGRSVGGDRAVIDQVRGPCNAQVPKQIKMAVQRWLRAQGPLPSRVQIAKP